MSLRIFPRRTPFPQSFPNIVIQRPDRSDVRVRAHPDFAAAKSGDPDAAWRLVDWLLNDLKTAEIEALVDGRKPTIVAVHAEEAAGRNALPQAYAETLADILGLDVDVEIVQANRPRRTGQSGLHRILTRSIFDGLVEAGKAHLLVDDHVTQGGTLADLRAFVEAQGGAVIGATTLTGNDKSARLAPLARTLLRLRTKFPGLEQEWEETFGYGFDGLTQSEAVYLDRYRTSDAVRRAILARQQEADLGPGEGIDRGEESREAEGLSAGVIAAPSYLSDSPSLAPSPAQLASAIDALTLLAKEDEQHVKAPPAPVTDGSAQDQAVCPSPPASNRRIRSW